MTEIHNGRCEITISVNGIAMHSKENIIPNGQMPNNNPIPAKPQRKKVSFHDNVTDIDEDDLSFKDGNNENQPKPDHKELEDIPNVEENTNNENLLDEQEVKEELEGILNVTEKINFFKSAFADEKNGLKSLGHQSSIPQARLAFVTGMVESSLAGNNLRARADSDVSKKAENGEDAEKKADAQVTRGTGELNPQSVSEMAATQVTFMKIFASPKSKNGVDETYRCRLSCKETTQKSEDKAVVDTSSILEHREEIRELWEKRMMADDNQSSPTSATVDATSTKPAQEEGKEEVVMSTTSSESETKSDHTSSNGFAKAAVESDNTEDGNANHIKEADDTKVLDQATAQAPAETDHDNNNCADSLEEDNAEEYVEEKTYTSETSLVMKSESVEVTSEVIVQITTVEEQVSEDIVKAEIGNEVAIEAEPADNVDGISSVEETIVTTTVETVSSREQETSGIVVEEQTKTAVAEDSDVQNEVKTKEALEEKGIKALEIPDCADEDGDGFVRIGECLPIGDNSEDLQDVDHEIFTDEQKNGVSNGDHSDPADSPSLPPTPDSALGDKLTHPEIEQFVKSGGLKRVLVQKTEQPYSTCTTETKIAMEIREMREREEELRVMREQALLSPVVSPQPPKDSNSPVPNGGGGASPVTNGGGASPVTNGGGASFVSNGGGVSPSCGYRVSSVFGHKGGVSPVAEGVKGGFGGKESAVEKEIRVARDREEELRKMKGLPPREDDSYVKPSQVKSSQVRVFGKVAGGNNMKQAATAKIQLEIEEQTQREMALRDTGSIQTISQERTDSKVAKLKTTEVAKPAAVNGQNGNSHPLNNGNHTNGGRSSPDVAPYKRGSPSPNGRPATIFSSATNGNKANNGISMHKFIASKGKEATFSAPVLRNGNGVAKDGVANIPPNMIKLKRTVSVESKIQQEIMEMKQREEELKLLHMNRSNENSLLDEDIMEHEMNQKNNFLEFENGNGVLDEDISPRHNKLIAQWEQRIQKAES